MLTTQLDHIAIAAQNLEQGVAYVQDLFGVKMPYGGEHFLMGTHNHVMRLGPELYIEVIAINPAAPPPARPRWFGLDAPHLQARLAKKPQLLTWVARCSNIEQLKKQSSIEVGEIQKMSRGELEWLISIPGDGSLPEEGLFPTLIQWPKGAHPASRMPDLGCHLIKFEIFHSKTAWFQGLLEEIELENAIHYHVLPAGKRPYFVLHFQTPKGVVCWSSL